MAYPSDPFQPARPVDHPAAPWVLHVQRLPPERLLVLLGGLSALLFGALALVLQLAGEARLPTLGFFTTTGGAVFTFVVALVFGALLLLAFTVMHARRHEGGVLALAFSIVLLAFGSIPGIIAGILGLVGSLVAVLRGLKLSG